MSYQSLTNLTNFVLIARLRRRLKGHPLQVRHKQDWDRGFIFLLPQASVLPDQMLAVMLLNQHRVLSFFYLYIYPPDSQESDGGAIRRVSNYPDLLPEMPRYCCPLLI